YNTETIKIWGGESYNGWTEPGHYERVLVSAAGCDSVVVTKLIVRGKGQEPQEGTVIQEPPVISKGNNSNNYSLETDGSNEFTIYPNPAQTFINVEYRDQPEIDTRIEVVDISGRVVHAQEAGALTNRIDFDQLNPGMYYLRSVNKHSQRVEKFVIQ
ncbi:MAG: T9SS type A sorting domain-containing protein, partial [Mariniphaga sp.]